MTTTETPTTITPAEVKDQIDIWRKEAKEADWSQRDLLQRRMSKASYLLQLLEVLPTVVERLAAHGIEAHFDTKSLRWNELTAERVCLRVGDSVTVHWKEIKHNGGMVSGYVKYLQAYTGWRTNIGKGKKALDFADLTSEIMRLLKNREIQKKREEKRAQATEEHKQEVQELQDIGAPVNVGGDDIGQFKIEGLTREQAEAALLAIKALDT